MWIIYALGSALFAALTSIMAKIGITGIDSNLATAIRTAVVLIIATGIVYMTGVSQQISNISQKCWLFLILSGIMTGLSWLCFFKALQLGETSRVVSIDKFSIVLVVIMSTLILKETINAKIISACILITIGTILMVV